MASTSTAEVHGPAAVPGPPRGRRRVVRGDLRARVAAARAAEEQVGGPAGLLRLLGEVILLLKDLSSDPRVPRRATWLGIAALGYLASPVDLVPDWLPVVGQVDDLIVTAYALRRMLAAAGYEVIYDRWRGSDEGLALLLTVAGVDR